MWYTKMSVNLISMNDKIKPSDQNKIEPVRKIVHPSPRTAKLAGIPIPLFSRFSRVTRLNSCWTSAGVMHFKHEEKL